MGLFPEVIFYAYTKSKILFDTIENKPKNLVLIYSLGSKNDNLIDTAKDRHSKIFDSETELINAGYIDASKNDLIAINKANHKIGLVIH
jgi:hypothetical protein